MAAVIPPQRRAPPAPVRPLRALVILPPHIHQQPLQQQRSPLAYGAVPVFLHLLEKLLVTEQRTARLRGTALAVEVSASFRSRAHMVVTLVWHNGRNSSCGFRSRNATGAGPETAARACPRSCGPR